MPDLRKWPFRHRGAYCGFDAQACRYPHPLPICFGAELFQTVRFQPHSSSAQAIREAPKVPQGTCFDPIQAPTESGFLHKHHPIPPSALANPIHPLVSTSLALGSFQGFRPLRSRITGTPAEPAGPTSTMAGPTSGRLKPHHFFFFLSQIR